MTTPTIENKQLREDLGIINRQLATMIRLLKSVGVNDPTGVCLAITATLLKTQQEVEKGLTKLGGQT